MKKAIFAICFCLAFSTHAFGKRSVTPPNIVLIIIDDMGWKDLGCTGSAYYETPNIDELAASGVLFNNAYASSAICAPSRATIFTGKHVARTKLTCTFNGEMAPDDRLYESSKGLSGVNQTREALHRHALGRDETLFAENLRDARYATAYFGKWHLGEHPDFTPDKRGFQVAKGYRTKHVPSAVSGHWGRTCKPVVADMDTMRDDEYLADALTDECIEFIEKNESGPFLAVLAHYLVHHPIDPKPELLKRFIGKPTTDQDNPGNAAMVASVDESVGRVVATLEKMGIKKNTLILFTSDNGGVIPRATSTYPLLGGKAGLFEGGTRVPFIASWPERIKPGRVVNDRVVGADLYPTVLAAAGITPSPSQTVDGVNLLPVLAGTASVPARPLVFHYPHYTKNIGPGSSIIEGRWKLIRFYNDEMGAYLLFDLWNDPAEQNDLSSQKPGVVKRLTNELDRQLRDFGAELPTPNPDYDPTSPKRTNRDVMYKAVNKSWSTLGARLRNESEPKSIFNGNDLSGWRTNNEACWSVSDGILLGENDPEKKGDILFTEKDDYRDFEVQFDFRLGEGRVDSGVFLRDSQEQIQIGMSGSLKRDMTALPYIPALKGYPIQVETAEDVFNQEGWNTLKVRVVGASYTTWLNGKEIMTYESSTIAPHGPIGIQVHPNRKMSISFRKILVTELASHSNSENQ